jgi:uncharacterized protein HemX
MTASRSETRKQKEAQEEARVLSQMGKGAPPPEEGSGLGAAVAILLIILVIGAAVWYFRIIPGWHP